MLPGGLFRFNVFEPRSFELVEALCIHAPVRSVQEPPDPVPVVLVSHGRHALLHGGPADLFKIGIRVQARGLICHRLSQDSRGARREANQRKDALNLHTHTRKVPWDGGAV